MLDGGAAVHDDVGPRITRTPRSNPSRTCCGDGLVGPATPRVPPRDAQRVSDAIACRLDDGRFGNKDRARGVAGCGCGRQGKAEGGSPWGVSSERCSTSSGSRITLSRAT